MDRLDIINSIEACDDEKLRLIDLDQRRLLVFHRCGLAENAEDIAKSFRRVEETGGQMPYTFVIGYDGEIEQALPIGDYGPHAKRWNNRGIGVAVVGDCRFRTPTLLQWDAAVRLCALMAGWATEGIKGHDELEDGSSDIGKRCPGEFFGMDMLRDAARDRAAVEMLHSGVIF